MIDCCSGLLITNLVIIVVQSIAQTVKYAELFLTREMGQCSVLSIPILTVCLSGWECFFYSTTYFSNEIFPNLAVVLSFVLCDVTASPRYIFSDSSIVNVVNVFHAFPSEL